MSPIHLAKTDWYYWVDRVPTDSSQSFSPIAVLSWFASSVPDKPRAASAASMKKVADRKRAAAKVQRVAEDEMREEYDFSNAKPNPYAARFTGDVRIVVLDPDVAPSFPDAESVNDALRALVRIARRPPKKPTSI